LNLSADSAGIAGAFEELPVLLVVLVAVSLFSVSVANYASSWNDSDEYTALQEDCLAFAAMVKNSRTLCEPDHGGIFSFGNLENFTAEKFLDEFNATSLGIGYCVTVQCLDAQTGEITLNRTVQTADLPTDRDRASFNSCVSVDNNGYRGAARLSVTVWRDGP